MDVFLHSKKTVPKPSQWIVRIPNFVWSVYSPIINQRTSGFEHFSPATHLRSLGILRGVFIKNHQPVDHGPRNLARVTHPDYQGVLCNLFLFQSVQEPCNIWTVSRHHAGLGVQMVHVRIVEVGGYALQLLTIGGPVDEEGLWILRPGQVHNKSMDDPSLSGETLNLNTWNSQTVWSRSDTPIDVMAFRVSRVSSWAPEQSIP